HLPHPENQKVDYSLYILLPTHISMDLHPSAEWDHPSTIVGQQISSTKFDLPRLRTRAKISGIATKKVVK
ncbi:MAG: hypothetical protein ACK5Y3_05970, partial [Pseudanabaena sp.]